MSIKQLVDDAQFLAANNRHVGALAALMLAVAGSARKRFPKKQRSLKDPEKFMGDAEMFELFLGGRLARLLMNIFQPSDIGTSGICIEFRGRVHQIEHILYKFYRCQLVHEAELPNDVRFLPRSQVKRWGIQIGNLGSEVTVTIDADGIVLDTGWIGVLVEAVTTALVNAAEFGLEHFDLRPKDGTEAKVLSEISDRFVLSEGRMQILKSIVITLTPTGISENDDDTLKHQFNLLLERGKITPSMNAGLSICDVTNAPGVLQPKGIVVLREMASRFELVRIA